MKIRFIKSKQATETIIREDLEYISEYIDKSGIEDCDAVFAVVNTFSKKRNNLVTIDVDVRRKYTSSELHKIFIETEKSLYKGSYELVDSYGNTIPCSIANPRARFGYDLFMP